MIKLCCVAVSFFSFLFLFLFLSLGGEGGAGGRASNLKNSLALLIALPFIEQHMVFVLGIIQHVTKEVILDSY